MTSYGLIFGAHTTLWHSADCLSRVARLLTAIMSWLRQCGLSLPVKL